MSLTTIRTYGWLTGTSPQVRNIGTYGWFAADGPPPVFPTQVSFAFRVPLAFRGNLLRNFSIPVEVNSDVTLITSEKSTPIERISAILVTDTISNDFLTQFSKTRNIAISNTRQINQLNLSPTAYLQVLATNKVVPIENKSDAVIITSEKSIPIGYLLYLDNQEKLEIEYGGITVAVSSSKLIPVEHLQNVVLVPEIPIGSLDYPLIWYLDERSVLWTLDARSIRWLVDNLSTEWILDSRSKNWIIPSDITDWILSEKYTNWVMNIRDTSWTRAEE